MSAAVKLMYDVTPRSNPSRDRLGSAGMEKDDVDWQQPGRINVTPMDYSDAESDTRSKSSASETEIRMYDPEDDSEDELEAQLNLAFDSQGNEVIIEEDENGVPKDSAAKLMFHLDNMCRLLDMENTQNIDKLRDFKRFQDLSTKDMNKLIFFSAIISPDRLINKCLFLEPAMCGDKDYKIYELGGVKEKLAWADNVRIGNHQRQVKKVMCCCMAYIEEYYVQPMLFFQWRLDRMVDEMKSSKQVHIDKCCTIL